METERAIEIVTKLADGIDPYTDQKIDSSSPYQNADTVRALQIALAAMAPSKRASKRTEEGQGKFGKVWTDEEEKQMEEMFDAKVPVVEIGTKLERTKGAIWARLEKIGRVTRDENGKVTIINTASRPAEQAQEAPAQKEQQPAPAGCEF